MAQCHVAWDSYKKNICSGFSHLQQQEEFVDMTLVAEGHLVKVHKSLLALASPYLKEVILSAPCQHPVVFLTHISSEILGYIIEYVYTGEVVVPTHKMDAFIEAAKALQISGINNLIPPKKFQSNIIQHSVETDSDSFQEVDGTAVTNYAKTKNHTLSEFKIQTAPVAHLFISEYPQFNTENYNKSANQKENLISQNSLNCESLPDKSHTQQLSFQDSKNVTYESQYEKFVNPTSSLSLNPITRLSSKTNNLQMLNFDVPSINQTEELNTDANNKNMAIFNIVSEDKEHVVGDAIDMDIESQDENTELSKPATVLETAENKNYSINVEMPIGNTGPPKITIQAGVIENLSKKNNPPNTTQSNVFVSPSVSNTVPKITINAGIIQDSPSISIGKSFRPVEPDKCKEALTSFDAASPLYMKSSKGCLQMILNRFIYGIHHQTRRGKRWRCIDYRHKRCPAYVDTLDEKIVNRKFLHNHPFHDDKIMNRGSRKLVYESLEELSSVLKDSTA